MLYLLRHVRPWITLISLWLITPIGLQLLRFLFEGRVYENSFSSMADALLGVYFSCIAYLFQRYSLPSLIPGLAKAIVAAFVALYVGHVIVGWLQELPGPQATWAHSPANILHLFILMFYSYGVLTTLDIAFYAGASKARYLALVCLGIWVLTFVVDLVMGNLNWPHIAMNDDIYRHVLLLFHR